ncbi:MAG: hypothetical protein AAGK04_00350 [Planctomycetota bacterium]
MQLMISTMAAMACAAATQAQIAPICVDWSVDGQGNTLVNGQQLTDSSGSVFAFGSLFTMETFGGNLGATIFDTDPAGPNATGPDPDLLVDRGNGMILQNNSDPTQTTPGIFDTPNDATNNGSYSIDFTDDVLLESIDLLDINGGNDVEIDMIDANGNSRMYLVPSDWTGDPTNNPPGWATLDLTSLADQFGGGPGLPAATATEDAGFDPGNVDRMEIRFIGSGAWNNLKFVPAPGAMALLGLGGLAAARRRR